MTPWRFSLLGYKAGFAQPWFLLGIGLALLLGVIAIVVSVRRNKRLAKAVPQRLADVLAPGVSTVLPSLQSSAYTMALIFFALALAQPQCGEKAEVAKRRGIDVVVALDASKSMYARDVTPLRSLPVNTGTGPPMKNSTAPPCKVIRPACTAAEQILESSVYKSTPHTL